VTSPANFSTPDTIIRSAMIEAKLLQTGDDPSSENYAEYMPRLNHLINTWQTDGLRLWLNFDQSVTLVAGTAKYSFSPTGAVVMTRPLRVIDGYYLDSSSNRRPLWSMGRLDYDKLSNVTNQGAVNSYFVDKQQTTLDVYFWMTPDTTAATGTAHVILQQQVTNFTGLTDTMNFPVEWYLSLIWGLADEICGGQPQAIMNRCAQRAAFYKEKLDNWDVEDASTVFTPDQRQTWGTGRFI